MINKICIYLLIITGSFSMLINSCKKEDDNKPSPPSSNETVKDIDSNIYHTVTIGSQVWMVENLKTTKYRNGDKIPYITDFTEWESLSTGAYCDCDNTPSNYSPFGRLYNWYSVHTGNLCPIGWHAPSDTEWTILTAYLGGDSLAGGKLKEIGTTYWEIANYGASNETGFTGLPAGFRGNYGEFYSIYSTSYWWSSTEYDNKNAWYRNLYNFNPFVIRQFHNKQFGLSVRCIKD